MLLPRLKQKEFAQVSKSTRILNDKQIRTYCIKEFIKAVEMCDVEDGLYVRHWIGEKMVTLCFSKAIGFGFCPQEFFAAGYEADELKLAEVFGVNEMRQFKREFPIPSDFIAKVKEEILNDKRRNVKEPKYSDIFQSRGNKFNYSDEEYTKILKFLSLCLDGKVPEADWDRYWEVGDKYIRKNEVEYKHLPSLPYIEKILYSVLKGITGYEEI